MRILVGHYLCILSLLAALGLPGSTAYAQRVKFGKIDIADLAMTTYDKDTTAAAVVLHNYCHVSFVFVRDQTRLIYNFHTRIKILKPSALDRADIEIPYYAHKDAERVLTPRGITYNLVDGKIEETRLEKEQIFTEALDEYIEVYKFAMPNVRAGSVFEYTYQLESSDLFNLRTWYIQQDIPVVSSELVTRLIDGVNYRRLMLGEVLQMNPKSERLPEDGGTRYVIHTTYEATDIPALKEEAYTTTVKNYVSRIEFQLQSIIIPGVIHKVFTNDWSELRVNLLEGSIGRELKATETAHKFLAPVLPAYQTTRPSPTQLVLALRQHARWNELYSIYPQRGVAKTLSEGTGNSADMNLAFIALLRAAGYDARPVLISTRRHGIVQNFYPMLHQFNHLITAIVDGDGVMLVDAANPGTTLDMLPVADLNGTGFMFGETSYNWVKIAPQHSRKHMVNYILTLQPDGTLRGNLSFADDGYEAAFRRSELRTAENEAAFIQEVFAQGAPGTEIASYEILQNEEKPTRLKLSCDWSSTDYGQATGDYIYFRPTLMIGFDENPFHVERRNYPVDFAYPIHESISGSIFLPEGYSLQDMPPPLRLVMPDKAASFTYQIEPNGSMIQFVYELKINQTVIQPDDYPLLRSFFDTVVQKTTEQLVVKRSN